MANMAKIQDKLAILPALPGCYLMKNKDGDIIYVGKAKKLKNRVRQYFVGATPTPETAFERTDDLFGGELERSGGYGKIGAGNPRLLRF